MKNENKIDLNPLVEKMKTDRKLLKQLKNASVRAQIFDLASKIRDLEMEFFPESEEVTVAKMEAAKLNLLFRMVGLEIKESACWLIAQAVKGHIEKKGEFSIKDATSLVFDKQRIFDDE